MDHLNLLQISSPADGLIYLNGTLAGELLGGALSLCIPRGRFCLSFSPLGQEEGKVFLPFSRISFSLPPNYICYYYITLPYEMQG